MEPIPRMPKKVEARVRAVMAHFQLSDNRAGFIAGNPGYGFDLTPDYVREPAVLFYLIHHVLEFLNLGTLEKSAWECTFTYRGVLASVALQKSGLRLYLDRRSFSDSASARKMARQAKEAIREGVDVVENQFLVTYGEAQLAKGNFTFMNQAHRLREMVDYFRDGARLAYQGEGRIPELVPGGGSRVFPRETEGFFNTIGMVTAYFSWLEHVLVLSHPFVSTAPKPETDIASFTRLRWGDKFKRLFDVSTDRPADEVYRSLRLVSERYRNLWAHGVLDKRGGALAFHLPGSGAIGMNLAGPSLTPSLYVLPFDERGFREVNGSFAGADAFLHEHQRTRLAMRWVEGGLDVAFNLDERVKYAVALHSDELFDDLMEYTSSTWAMHQNMDY